MRLWGNSAPTATHALTSSKMAAHSAYATTSEFGAHTRAPYKLRPHLVEEPSGRRLPRAAGAVLLQSAQTLLSQLAELERLLPRWLACGQRLQFHVATVHVPLRDACVWSRSCAPAPFIDVP